MKQVSQILDNGIAITLRRPAQPTAQPSPAIVLCHGFCGIQEILLPAFASAFTQAGFTTVTFDYRGFGASEGERGRLIPEWQIADILSVVDWLGTQPDVDAGRIGLWGTSFGGCHIFGAAARNPQIKCLVSQLAFADGEAIVTGQMSAEEKRGFMESLDKMAQKREATGKEMFVAITRVLSDEESRAFFNENKSRYPAMDIKIPFLTVRETLLYRPAENAARVNCPSLVVVAGADTVNPPEQGVALYEAVGAEQKQLYVEEGARHYDMYSGPYFEKAVAQQLAWFRQYL